MDRQTFDALVDQLLGAEDFLERDDADPSPSRYYRRYPGVPVVIRVSDHEQGDGREEDVIDIRYTNTLTEEEVRQAVAQAIREYERMAGELMS